MLYWPKFRNSVPTSDVPPGIHGGSEKSEDESTIPE